MAEKRGVVCPHCDVTNAVPTDREPLVARCGRCHQKLFEGVPAALDAVQGCQHPRSAQRVRQTEDQNVIARRDPAPWHTSAAVHGAGNRRQCRWPGGAGPSAGFRSAILRLAVERPRWSGRAGPAGSRPAPRSRASRASSPLPRLGAGGSPGLPSWCGRRRPGSAPPRKRGRSPGSAGGAGAGAAEAAGLPDLAEGAVVRAASRQVHADRAGVYFVRLRTEPRGGAAYVATRTGTVRTFSVDTEFVCTGRSAPGWVHVRTSGGQSRGWLRRNALR